LRDGTVHELGATGPTTRTSRPPRPKEDRPQPKDERTQPEDKAYYTVLVFSTHTLGTSPTTDAMSMQRNFFKFFVVKVCKSVFEDKNGGCHRVRGASVVQLSPMTTFRTPVTFH
jgi:hypothetical protein